MFKEETGYTFRSSTIGLNFGLESPPQHPRFGECSVQGHSQSSGEDYNPSVLSQELQKEDEFPHSSKEVDERQLLKDYLKSTGSAVVPKVAKVNKLKIFC